MDPSKMGAKVLRFVPPDGYEHLDYTKHIRHIGRQMCTDGVTSGRDPITPSFVITITNDYDMHCTPLDNSEGEYLVSMWNDHEVTLSGLVMPAANGTDGYIILPFIRISK